MFGPFELNAEPLNHHLESDNDNDESEYDSPISSPAHPRHFVPKTQKELAEQFDKPEARLIGPPPVSFTWAARPKRSMTTSKGGKPYDEEDAEIELLYAQARKHAELGKKLEASRTRIDAIGANIESAAGPVNGVNVYRETQALQATNQNVNKVLEQLSIVQRPLEGKADEERIIQQGPAEVGLPAYLACIRRAANKCEELSVSGARVNQEAALQLSDLVNFGIKQLLDLFNGVLEGMSATIEPLSFITRDEPFPTFDPRNSSQLVELSSFMMEAAAQFGRASGKSVGSSYADIRGRYLQKSLANLAAATVTSGKRRRNPEELYQQNSCVIAEYAKGLSLAFTAEWSNVCQIFRQDRRLILEATVGVAITEFEKTIQELNTQIKQNLVTDCFMAYDILGVVNNLAFELEKQTGCLKQEIFGAVKPVRDTAKQSVSDLIEDIRRRISSMVFLPADGAALPFTTEVLTRLQYMTAYPAPLGSILSSVGDGNWTSASSNNSSASLPTIKSFDVNPDTSGLLSHYIMDSLEMLFTNLDNRSRTLNKNKAVTGIFIINNVAVADRMIRSSDLAQYIGTQSSSKLDVWRKKARDYTGTWNELTTFLMDTQYTSRGQRPPSGNAANTDSSVIVKSLGSKDKDAIKEKFKNFNILFDALCTKHRELMPAMEQEVRLQLMTDIKAVILPLYGRFWDRYHEIDKGKGKYVRYNRDTLTSQLNSLA